MKTGFYYEKNEMMVDGVSLSAIAAEHGTPLYVYSAGQLRANFRRVAKPFARVDHLVAYSVKSNSNLSVLRLLEAEGAGFDIVSGGELERVRKVGVPGERIIFAGVGKTQEEMAAALKAGVLEFNVESEAEAERLNLVAGQRRTVAPVALRVNPDVDAHTHKHITTGKAENKFGISMKRALELAKRFKTELPNLRLDGIHCHVGSQILDPGVHPQVVAKVGAFADELTREAGAKLRTLNLGGGFGIAYRDDQQPLDLKPFAAAVAPLVKRLGVKLILEPGRSISASAGVILATVEYIKRGDSKTFVIIDAAMTELIRPTLYEAHHRILPLTKRRATQGKVDVVGPVCESGDFLAKDREMPVPEEGELLAIMDAGAYAFVMASNYNSRPMSAEVLVEDGKARVVRKRQTMKDLLKAEM